MDLGFLLVSFVFIVALGYYYLRRKLSYWEIRGVPSVKPSFPLNKSLNLAQILQSCYHELKGKGSFGGFYFLSQPVAIPTDLDLLKNILVKDFQSFHDRGLYCNPKADPLTGHLLALSGAQWKNMRSKLSPTFTSGKMKMMHQTMLFVADSLKDHLASYTPKKSEIEIKEVLAKFTTDVIGNVAFGIDVNSLSNPDNEFRRMGRKHIEEGPFLKILFSAMYTDFAKKINLKLLNPEVREFIMNLVKDTVEYREKNNVQRNDFMSLLIQIKNTGTVDGEIVDLGTLTIEEIAAQTFIFFVAGFETSSSTMTFALYELAINQDIQDRVREEIKEVLESSNGILSYEAVMKLKYLEQIISETLRKYPVVPTLIRQTGANYKVPNSNNVIEKDTQVMIPVFAIQRDPEIYPDPDKFDPERFTPENIKARHPYAWLPFGEGPRNCIGMRFGLMQTKVGLATILSNFRVTPSSKTPIPMKFNPKGGILSPIGGMHLNIETV